ncbi:hypothetical protein E1264_38085 [Actinomadura sp. KC216]|uniref:hypothetical protein n=1 Tax=Actinomadura sp. KC216 TaxID=2530370 RepID=UPI00104B4D7A|nr:hypothetical protein [Actinomadura sp. KC216]TDB76800.1 hypothetical protein E1264_38085 [Actinomadura sp. KC216]
MNRIPPHAECADLLTEQMAALGVEVTVVDEPPPPGPRVPEARTCPHGGHLWAVPTPAQVARWARDGAPNEFGVER